VLELVRQLAGQNVAVICMTHNMNNVTGVTDRVFVLYTGCVALEAKTSETNPQEIVSVVMTGRQDGMAGRH
jgi:ABC-type sugar transport system ATPase subunit